MKQFILVLVAWLAVLTSLPGQEKAKEAAPAKEVAPAKEEAPVLTTLKNLVEAMAALKEEQAEVSAELARLREAKAEPGQIAAASEKFQRLVEEFDKLEGKLSQLATGINEETFEVKEREAFDLGREVEFLLEPIVYELKKATEKPREIERLRADQAHFERRQEQVQTALRKLDLLIADVGEGSLRDHLLSLRKGWKAQEGRIQSELEAANLQLAEAEESQEGVVGLFGRILQEFFASRGKSFLLAILGGFAVFAVVAFVIRMLDRVVPDTEAVRRSLSYRLGRLTLQAFAILCSVFTMVGILYAQSDWLLLGLAIIFLVGIIWAARKALLPFYHQFKMMLNLGSVREGERVMFDGIPWEVERIGFYTDLVNPLLTGGVVRVMLEDLTKLHSRPKARKEPLFPCRAADWVQLSDGTYGEVLSQTPELVRLRTVPGSVVSYQTASFLGLAPDNHSGGFGLRVQVGVDYQHQALSTREIPAKLAEHIRLGLGGLIPLEQVERFGVEFSSAGASSLDYTILVTFSGELAGRKQFLERAIQRLFVDACNENGWTIPFMQITLHQAA